MTSVLVSWVPVRTPFTARPPGFDPDEVVSQIVELLFDPRLASFTDGHNANHRGNADGDA